MSDLVDKASAWDSAQVSYQKGYDKAKQETAEEITRLRTSLSEAEQRVKDARRVALEDAALRVDAKANAYEEEARDLRGSDSDRRFCASVAVRLRGASSDIRALQSEER